MRVNRIISAVKSKVSAFQNGYKEARISKYFKISDIDTYGDSHLQMYHARKGIADYAKSKGVKIFVQNAENPTDRSVPSKIFKDKLAVVVTDSKTGNVVTGFVSALTDRVYPKVKQTRYMHVNQFDGVEKNYNVTNHLEDTFLSNLYRNIETLTAKVMAIRK